MHPTPVVALASSSNGRVSGKPWKADKAATVRSQQSKGLKTKRWEDRMEKTKKEQAIKKLQEELKAEKQADYERRVPHPVAPCILLKPSVLPPGDEKSRWNVNGLQKKSAELKRPKRWCESVFFFPPGTHTLMPIQMGARKAARLRKRAGRSKTVNH